MTSTPLSNHLRSQRKRLALSLDDVAFMMGQSAATICRFERFQREPNLKQAIALEAIYKTPLCELFPGLYQQIEQEIAQGAQNLSVVNRGAASQRETRKNSIKAIAAPVT